MMHLRINMYHHVLMSYHTFIETPPHPEWISCGLKCLYGVPGRPADAIAAIAEQACSTRGLDLAAFRQTPPGSASQPVSLIHRSTSGGRFPPRHRSVQFVSLPTGEANRLPHRWQICAFRRQFSRNGSLTLMKQFATK
jgi:hypothetical protein